MRAVRRIHDHCAVSGVQPLENGVKRLVSLLIGSKSADDRPGLRIQPHIGFRSVPVSDYVAVFFETADEPVFVPAQSIQFFPELFLCLSQKSEIFSIFPVLRELLHNPQSIVELECDECGFARFAQAQAVVPVGMKARRHPVGTHMVHREADGAL